MFNPRRNKKGFTLIELIVVIAIIAILAAIAIPSFIGITDEANKKVDVANATNIATAVNSYNALNPDDMITSADTAYATVHGALTTGMDLWPKGLDETAYGKAMTYITWDGNAMLVNPDAEVPAAS